MRYFLAAVSARSVIGIGLNEGHLAKASRIQSDVGVEAGPSPVRRPPIGFYVMDAASLDLPDGSVDVVLADNALERFASPLDLILDARRGLRPTGILVVPGFSSISSKCRLNLKYGLKVSWGNLPFSEMTIVNALAWLTKDNPVLLDIYPGLRESPILVRVVRRHKDLNDISCGSFKRLAADAGFPIS